MLSRVAESIYWMSRYIERAENVARFIEVNLQLMLDSPPGENQQWQPLVNTTGDHVDFEKRYGAATQQDVLHFLTFDAENPNSILSCLRVARENARTVREIISSEMWLQLNKFYLMVNSAAENPKALEEIIDAVSPDRLATLIYTSGTTGRPKGVALTHDCWCYEGLAMAQIGTLYYFVFFLVIMPLLGLIETPRRMPNSITEAVLEKNKGGSGHPVGAAASPSTKG